MLPRAGCGEHPEPRLSGGLAPPGSLLPSPVSLWVCPCHPRRSLLPAAACAVLGNTEPSGRGQDDFTAASLPPVCLPPPPPGRIRGPAAGQNLHRTVGTTALSLHGRASVLPSVKRAWACVERPRLASVIPPQSGRGSAVSGGAGWGPRAGPVARPARHSGRLGRGARETGLECRWGFGRPGWSTGGLVV